MVKCLGYELKKGDFTNSETGEVIAYDNVTLHCVSDEDSMVDGCSCYSLKVKRKFFPDSFNFKEIIGSLLNLGYVVRNNKTYLSSVKVVPSDKK